MAGAIRSDRTWNFAVPADRFWERISATDEYRDWWGWLRQAETGRGIRVGERWACTVSPPLPYSVRFVLLFDHVEVGRVVETTVTGDIEGLARLTISDTDGGCRVNLASALRPSHPVFRTFAVLARPVVERGHDWILDEGSRQFQQRALG